MKQNYTSVSKYSDQGLP